MDPKVRHISLKWSTNKPLLAEVSLADLMKELNVKDAALFKEQNYEGKVTAQQFLRLGILHKDQLDAMKDDLAQTQSLSTS